MTYLTIEQIIKEQKKLIDSFGGSQGIRDESLIESAYCSSIQSFNGKDLYPSIEEKTACLAFNLCKNHGFIDGNKRIAVHVLLINLIINGIELQYTQEDLIVLGINMAQRYTKKDILHWINIRKIKLNRK